MEISIKSSLVAIFFLWSLQFGVSLGEDLPIPSFGPLVTKESRRTLVSTDSGVITAVDVHDRYRGPYHLQFITLETSSLLLPVILHTDMVFYVHSGRGAVNWITEDHTNRIEVRRGDIYRLGEGTVFYVQSHPDPTREKLRIHAIFNPMLGENPSEVFVGAYSNISDLVRGFDDEVLQMAFGVSEEVVQGIKGVERPLPIVHYEPKNETDEVDWREGIFEALIGGRHPMVNGKKKKKEKTKTLNLVDRKPDIENCNGRSVAVTSNEFKPLKGSDIGIFMVNLTRGSMMGPHWNPKATEIAIVTHGQGIVQIVCPSKPSGVSSEDFRCQSTKFKVNEGDIFIVPRYHPMAQISFNNDSFVLVGFTTMASQNHPQFLAGKRSVLRTLDREILARSFNAANTTIDHLLDSQLESVMFECVTCAEDLEKKIEEEIERKRQEEEARKREEARRREEEQRKREEEEAKRREEEEARKREEEEAKRREEEEKKREEEEAKRREEEEEARKREEEEARKREEEEQRKSEEEEKKREEEEAKRREEEARKREEEEARKREEEEQRRREEEEEEARKREDEEARKREEEEQRKREEEQKKREEEEAKRRQQQEEEEEEEEEEARKREEEEQRKREEEEMQRRQEEEEKRGQQEEGARRQEEEEARRQEEEEARRQEEEEARRQEEEARRQEEEEARRQEEEEEEARREKEEGEARREEEKAREKGEAAAKKWEQEIARKGEEEQKQMQVEKEEQARLEQEKQAKEEPANREVVEEGKGAEKRMRKMWRG